MAPPPVEEHQAPRTSIQSKTKKFFSPSGLESFFKKSSLKVGLANFKEPVAGDAFDRIKVHGERKSVSSTAEGAGDVAVTLKRNFTGRSKLDYLLNTIIEHILRDFIHSWFSAVSTDKEFVDVRSKHSIEETIGDVCLRCVASKSPLVTVIHSFCWVSGSSRYHGSPYSRQQLWTTWPRTRASID